MAIFSGLIIFQLNQFINKYLKEWRFNLEITKFFKIFENTVVTVEPVVATGEVD